MLSTIDLEKMTQPQLDELFRKSPAGDIPRGEGKGTVLVAPGSELTDTAAKLIHLIAWHGKVLDPDSGELRNKILPFRIKAILAKVSESATWTDGREAI